MARGQTRRDSLHLSLRRFNSLSLLDPPDRLTIAADARLHLAAVARDRRPDLGIARKFEIGRHYADNYRPRPAPARRRLWPCGPHPADRRRSVAARGGD